MKIAIPLYERLTALDAIGPYEVLQRIPDATVHFVGRRRGIVRTENGMLGLQVDHTYEELPEPEVVIVPGGIGSRALLKTDPILDWLRKAHERTRYTASVCTGSLILAAAGLLEGVDATTHWSTRSLLAALGANPVLERVVERGRIMTAAGVSAGIDMALLLAERLTDRTTAQAVQLIIEYDPDPPYRMMPPETTEKAVIHRVSEIEALRD